MRNHFLNNHLVDKMSWWGNSLLSSGPGGPLRSVAHPLEKEDNCYEFIHNKASKGSRTES